MGLPFEFRLESPFSFGVSFGPNARVIFDLLLDHDVITPDCPTVNGHLNVQTFVEEQLLRTGDRCFMVLDNTGLAGLVTPHEVKTLDRARWPYTTVFDIMRPIDEIRAVQPGTPLKAALEIMGRENLNQLPVLRDHHLEGVLTRARVVSFLHNRFELQP